MSIVNSQISYNTASGVRIHIQNCSHRLDGKIADVLAPTHDCTTAIASVNYSRCVPQRPAMSHRPDGKIADVLALTHACTTANASVNYRMYVLQRH